MSDSYHVTKRSFKHCSKRELDEQFSEADSDFAQWAKKRSAKKNVKLQRKEKRALKDINLKESE